DSCADRRADAFQCLHVLAIKISEQRLELSVYPAFGHEAAATFGGQRKTGWHLHSGVDQLSEGGALATDQGNGILPAFLEPANQWSPCCQTALHPPINRCRRAVHCRAPH